MGNVIFARFAPLLAGAVAVLALAGGFWWLIDRNADLRRDNEALRNQIEKREDIDNAVDDVRELDPDQLDRWLRDRASQ